MNQTAPIFAALPPPAALALFLDFDGTLAGIAPTPDSVEVPAWLPDLLVRAHQALGGALAVVSGRALAVLDRMLGEAPLPLAGSHGAELRLQPGAAVSYAAAVGPPRAAAAQLEAVVAAHPDLLLETKPFGFALHWRRAPEMAGIAREAAEQVLAMTGDAFTLLDAHMAIELRPAAADKGRAVARFLEEPAFAARQPWFIGDDVTDEAGMEICRLHGGGGLLIPDDLAGPEMVYTLLRRLGDSTRYDMLGNA